MKNDLASFFGETGNLQMNRFRTAKRVVSNENCKVVDSRYCPQYQLDLVRISYYENLIQVVLSFKSLMHYINMVIGHRTPSNKSFIVFCSETG